MLTISKHSNASEISKVAGLSIVSKYLNKSEFLILAGFIEPYGQGHLPPCQLAQSSMQSGLEYFQG